MSENKWTEKEQIKFKNLNKEDQEELWEHAFDWCVNFSQEDIVIDILNDIGKAIHSFNEFNKKGGKIHG